MVFLMELNINIRFKIDPLLQERIIRDVTVYTRDNKAVAGILLSGDSTMSAKLTYYMKANDIEYCSLKESL
jgi:small nuclear ribonucleoprotein (snRNP)-like protein